MLLRALTPLTSAMLASAGTMSGPMSNRARLVGNTGPLSQVKRLRRCRAPCTPHCAQSPRTRLSQWVRRDVNCRDGAQRFVRELHRLCAPQEVVARQRACGEHRPHRRRRPCLRDGSQHIHMLRTEAARHPAQTHFAVLVLDGWPAAIACMCDACVLYAFACLGVQYRLGSR